MLKQDNLNYVEGEFPDNSRVENVETPFFERYPIDAAIKSFAITNTFYFIGIVILTLTGDLPLLSIGIISLDFGVINIFILWLTSIFHTPILIITLILGWLVSAIWARRKYVDKYTIVIILASQLPMLVFASYVIVFLLLSLPILGTFTLNFLLTFLQFVLVGGVIILIPAIFGLFFSSFISGDQQYAYKLTTNDQFLRLSTPPDEPISICPFKMRDHSGCSFLGYEVKGNYPMICNYESTYLRCRVYEYVFHTIMGDYNED